MINRLIGNYRITAELAQGGMGTVYRGRHQNLPREVVVKAIRLSSFPPRDQELLKTRFVREAYIQSQLDHPNTVRVYEFFTTEENYYLVMEFIDGMSLSDLVQRRGALEPAHALPLLKQALWGLAYAHKFSYVDESGRGLTGIIHRDIKPANLLLDGMGRLKITDFGIVKLAGESGMTRTGFNPGTVEYMSPEQIRGLVVDARSDIYSLGVTFYEALSGRLPFPPTDTGSEYEVMRGHTELPPPPLAEVRPELPAPLAALVMRSLEKDPAARFQTAAEWLEAILDYENRAATQGGTEVIAALPTQETNRLTERIDAPVVPTAPVPTTNLLDPPEPLTGTPTQSKPKSRGAVLFVGSAFVLLLMLAAAAYFVWQRQAASTGTGEVVSQSTPTVTATATPAATATTVPAVAPLASATPPDLGLRAASDAEEAENYLEAIKLYEEYLRDHAVAADAATVSSRLKELKAFNGHLTMAKVEMDQGDFAEARKDYSAALKVRPASKLAKAGLAAADARRARQ